jgi:hypothetical protein
MRLSSIVLSILFSSLVVPGIASAQSAAEAVTLPDKPVVAVAPADPVLSVEARMAKQLVQERRVIASTHGCPVAFTAEREGSLGLRQTKNPNQNPGMGLDLGFHSEQRVVEADITVYGWSKQLRMVPAANPPETSESFVLNGTNEAPIMRSLVWMKRLGVVNSVELTRVVFSDGGIWSQAGDMHCTVVPSKLVLVDASAGLK